jgi:hypothetical protein
MVQVSEVRLATVKSIFRQMEQKTQWILGAFARLFVTGVPARLAVWGGHVAEKSPASGGRGF